MMYGFYCEREEAEVGKVVTFLYLSHVKIENCLENIAELAKKLY